MTSEFPAQRASKAENVSIWRRPCSSLCQISSTCSYPQHPAVSAVAQALQFQGALIKPGWRQRTSNPKLEVPPLVYPETKNNICQWSLRVLQSTINKSIQPLFRCPNHFQYFSFGSISCKVKTCSYLFPAFGSIIWSIPTIYSEPQRMYLIFNVGYVDYRVLQYYWGLILSRVNKQVCSCMVSLSKVNNLRNN